MTKLSVADLYREDESGGSPTGQRSAPVRLLLNAAHLYRLRLREKSLQELLALFGIAAGVALLFAVQVASTSLTGGVRQLIEGITGEASVELAARGPEGVDQRLVDRARHLPSVRGAAPVLQRPITVIGPAGSASLNLVGTDERLASIGGRLVRRFNAKRRELGTLGFFLTSSTAKSIGAQRAGTLTIEVGAKKREVILAGILGADEIGSLKESPVAVAPLGMAQRLAEMRGRISRVLVAPKAGSKAEAMRELKVVAGDGVDVRDSGTEVGLLVDALKPDRQSTALFGAIAVVIGLLFAYNAVLLAMAWRRRFIAYLRLIGADRPTVIATLAFEALVLGVVASLVGLLLGNLLSNLTFKSIPTYLTAGFPLGTQRVIDARSVVLSVVGGLAATFLALARPAYELFRVNPGEAIVGWRPAAHKGTSLWSSRMLWLGLLTIAVTSGLLFLSPKLVPIGIPGLIVGLVLLLGPVLAGLLNAISRVTRERGDVGFALAVEELKGDPGRATALAVIAAISVAALVSIGGARLDLQRGVNELNRDLYETSELWLVPGDLANSFLTRPFAPNPTLDRLRGKSEIKRVSIYRGSLLDVGPRRLLVVARSPQDTRLLARAQVIAGDAELAEQRIRAGGWVALSNLVAKDMGDKRPGDRVVIPTPTGSKSFRLAATLANYRWPSGAIVMNGDDYRRAWHTKAASALAIYLAPGVSPIAGKRAVEQALGPAFALRIQTAGEMVSERDYVVAQGLTRMQQISALMLIAAVLAIVAAMFAAVWQRRARLASLRAIGLYKRELYRALFSETTLVVLLGGIAGLALGLYSQYFASGWAEIVTGYRSPYEPALGLGLTTLAKAVVLTALATAAPAFLAARVAPRVGEEA